MFCPKCGSQQPDGAVFCSACGASIQNTSANDLNGNQQSNTANDLNGNQQLNTATDLSPQQGALPMKWWKFLVYFSLFAAAVYNVIYGIVAMTGAQYGDNASLVYSFFSDLKTLDSCYGICLIGLAVFAIITRQHLHGYKKDAPKMLLMLYGLELVFSVIYMLLASSIIGVSFSEMLSADLVTSIIVSIVMIFVNKVYFDKRASMFVN